MLNFPPWKSVLSIFVIVISMFIVGNDFYKKIYDGSYKSGIKLGLDLQGGSSLVLEADENVFMQDYTTSLLENIKSILTNEKIAYYNLFKEKGSVSFSLQDTSKIRLIRSKVFEIDKDLDVTSNGSIVTVIVTDATKNSQLTNVIQNSIEVVRRRIDQTEQVSHQ